MVNETGVSNKTELVNETVIIVNKTVVNGTGIADSDISLRLLQVIGLTLPALGIFFNIVLKDDEDLRDRHDLSMTFFFTAVMLTFATGTIVTQLDSTERSWMIRSSFGFIYTAFLLLTTIGYQMLLESRRDQMLLRTEGGTIQATNQNIRDMHPKIANVVMIVCVAVTSVLLWVGAETNIGWGLLGITVLAAGFWIILWEP